MISLSCLRFGVFVKRYRLLLEKLKFIFPISNIKNTNHYNKMENTTSIDIVNLIENYPISKININCKSKLIEKIQSKFTTYEQMINRRFIIS